jgi:hypothetical protein
MWLHQTLIEALSPGRASAEKAMYGPLRPRNNVVPSARPIQKHGCTGPVRQLEPGLEEGQHPATVGDYRRLCKSQSGRPIKGQGSGIHGLCTPERRQTQPEQGFERADCGLIPCGSS